eukprot:TRINITY_DN12778_c0_g1_i1.p1 TRINITY_DN12778_c0_g1~~TRINITY_DN12778_c0_g1_i1.p1  ORF type:complete len:141 (-),score=36.33 TRINITY_DN12778_c0_g1_i1:146-568(-)
MCIRDRSRPSSADKIRPTTAGHKRSSKSRPSSAGMSRETALKPAVWLEPNSAKNLHEEEKRLHDVFAVKKNRPGSAGSKRNRNNRASPRKPVGDQNRPSSAEKRGDQELKNSVWLTDKAQRNVVQIELSLIHISEPTRPY